MKLRVHALGAAWQVQCLLKAPCCVRITAQKVPVQGVTSACHAYSAMNAL